MIIGINHNIRSTFKSKQTIERLRCESSLLKSLINMKGSI